MTHATLNDSVPQFIYGYVDKRILYGMDEQYRGQFEPCCIFGVTSRPSRCLHFSILCESGAQWANIPIHMLRHELPTSELMHVLPNVQCWDNHGWDFSTVQYQYLREMGCKYRAPADNTMIPAEYWFTLDHTDNGYSQHPPEHKCYHLLLLKDGTGQIAAMPNNRILWDDKCFVKRGDHKLDYKVMSRQVWHAENSRVNPQDTAHTKD